MDNNNENLSNGNMETQLHHKHLKRGKKFIPDEELLTIFQDFNESDIDNDFEIEEYCDISDEEDLECDNNTDIDEEDEGEEEKEIEDEFTYRSKSGFSWESIPPKQSQTLLTNNIRTSFNENFTTMKDAFHLFFTEEIMDHICKETNKQRECDNINKIRKRNISLIDCDEIAAFIGILLCSGRQNNRKINFNDLWTSNQLFKHFFYSAAMSRNRFYEIFSVVRFDDLSTRKERFNRSGDKMEAFKLVFEKFVCACNGNCIPGTNITIEERILVYNGKCKFTVLINNKPGNYGIKLRTAVDSKTSYCLNLQVYTGRNNKRREKNQKDCVVMELLRPYYGTGRGVITDSCFTSIPMAEKLLEKKLTITGTLKSNNKEIPREFLPSKDREQYSSLFGFTKDMTLVSYVPKAGQAVALLSTEFHDKKCAENIKKRPEIITHYNRIKYDVDITNKMTKQNSCIRTTTRWALKLFMELIDIAALNTYILWTEKFPDWKKSDSNRLKIFIEELSIQLISNNVNSRRKYKKTLKRIGQTSLDIFTKYSENIENKDEEILSTPNLRKRARCFYCPRNEDKKTNIQCVKCNRSICLIHRIENKTILCINCND